MYYLAQDDIVQERIQLARGSLAVPTSAGLAVTVDMEKLEHYAQCNQEEGDHTL